MIMHHRTTGAAIATTAGAAACLFTATPRAEAALSPPGSSEEQVIFADDFDNGNVNNWSNIGPDTQQATIGADPGPTSEDVWCPSIADSGETYSRVDLPRMIDLSKEQAVVYMRVRVDTPKAVNLNVNLFRSILFEQSPGSRYFNYEARPGGRTGLLYRDQDGAVKHVVDNAYIVTFPDASTYLDFRMGIAVIDADHSLAEVTLEKYDASTSQYVPAHHCNFDPAPHVGGGVLDRIQITSANHAVTGTDNRAYFDSVMVTVIPNPGQGTVITLR